MADCHAEFQRFRDAIALTSGKRSNLRRSRKELRKRIRKHFTETRKEAAPKFWEQGSYAMHTMVNPLDGEYDIDDGVYLRDHLGDDRAKWPTPQTVHRWILDAVEGHTNETKDKRTCVRVIYAGDYHVDLPIYGEDAGNYYLAETGDKGWHVSDPKALTEWLQGQVRSRGEQLRRLVLYFKAWADYQAKRNGKLPSGLIFTILVAEQFRADDRDDVAFGHVARGMYERFLTSPLVIRNPVDPAEDLAERLTDEQTQRLRRLLALLTEDAALALRTKKKSEACAAWRRQFGDRFPECEDEGEKEEKALKTSAPAILRDDARSA